MHKLSNALVAACLVVAFSALKPAQVARAAGSWSVCSSGCNFTSIAGALTDSGVLAGDTISVHSGVYSEHGIFIDKSVSIVGAGSGLVTVDGGSLGRVFEVPNGVTVAISGMTITHGQITGQYGAGMYMGGATVTMNDVIVTGNSSLGSAGFGGGIGVYQGGTLTMTNSQITANSSYFSGAGIEGYFGSTIHLTNVLIQDNTISGPNGSGAGIQLNSDSNPGPTYESTLTLDHVTLNHNTGGWSAAGIYVQHAATVTMSDSTISNNGSNTSGTGGLYLDGNSTLTITNSTVSGNDAGSNNAGGLEVALTATATLTNVTVANNLANNGGGIHNDGTLTVTNSTISGNSAASSSDGAGIYNSGTLNMVNTIVADSVTGEDCANAGTLSTNTNNLIEDATCSAALSGDPMLGALGNHSGPTQTLPLLAGSPAMDAGLAGSCSATDQRGQSRPVDGDRNGTAVCDIGSFEYVPQAISLSASSLNFGNQLVGTASAVKTVLLHNIGDHVLTIASITTLPPFSTLGTGNCPLAGGTVAARSSCTIKVLFSPALVGLASHNLTIVSNAVNTPKVVALSGTGVAGTQLLKNASFETDSNLDKRPDGWAFANFNAATDARDCTTFKLGACSLKLVGNGTNKIASQTILKTGTAGNDFTFTLWSRAASIPAASVYRLQVLFFNGTTLQAAKTMNFAVGTHNFQRIGGNFTTTGPYTKIVFQMVLKAGSGSAWFDAAALNWAP